MVARNFSYCISFFYYFFSTFPYVLYHRPYFYAYLIKSSKLAKLIYFTAIIRLKIEY